MATTLTAKIAMNDAPKSFDSDESGKIDIQKGQLTLPFTQDQFKDFVSGLFGNPDSLSSNFEGIFNIELGDLRTVHSVIEERIREQNKGLLAQFNATIKYDDGSSEDLQFESFFNLSEFIPRIPRVVNLTWQYLIKFENRNVPEKQEISINISTRGRPEDKEFSYTENKITLSIKYTSRSWAFDMESNISNYFKSLAVYTKKRKKIAVLLAEKSERVGWIGGIIFFLLSCLGGLFAAINFGTQKINFVEKFISTKPDLNQQINFLINLFGSGETTRFYFFLTIFLILMALFAVLAGASFTNVVEFKTERNHILLTRLAKEEMNKDIKNSEKKFIAFIRAAIVAICINLISSFIFIALIN